MPSKIVSLASASRYTHVSALRLVIGFGSPSRSVIHLPRHHRKHLKVVCGGAAEQSLRKPYGLPRTVP